MFKNTNLNAAKIYTPIQVEIEINENSKNGNHNNNAQIRR